MARSARGMLITFILVLLSAASLAAHDLFLKLDNYFVKSGDSVVVHVLNGTFTKSEGSIARIDCETSRLPDRVGDRTSTPRPGARRARARSRSSSMHWERT